MSHSRIYFAALTAAFLAFLAVQRFFDPYRVLEEKGRSSRTETIRAGDKMRVLLELAPVAAGTRYRVEASGRWEGVVPRAAAWESARLLFVPYGTNGRSVPAPHSALIVFGTGRGSFREVFTLPPGVASVRLMLQHAGKSGRLDLDAYSVEQIEVKPASGLGFAALRVAWFALAVWTVARLRLPARRHGIWVLLCAGLIAGGMLISAESVVRAPIHVADAMRPGGAAVPTPTVASRTTSSDPVPAAQAAPAAPAGRVARLRLAAADLVGRLDPFFWGHAVLFGLLGLSGYACFGRNRGGVWRGVLGLAVFAVASELLQVTVLSRSVRGSDIGINLAGLAVGLAAGAAVRTRAYAEGVR